MTATGADGTRYELVLPANAVLQETDITLTPVASIAGYPFAAGMSAGVQFAPDGLRLMQPAVLRIAPATAAATRDLTGFAYAGNGTDFHMIPAAADGAVSMRVYHFSGAGFGVATAAERGAQQQRVPRTWQAHARQRMGEILEEARSCAVAGSCDDLTDEQWKEVEALYEEWWQRVISPLLEAAKTGGCAATDAAFHAYTVWERERSLMGMPSPESRYHEVTSIVRQGMRNCLDEEYETCRVKHDLGAIARILWIGRLAQLLLADEELTDRAVDRAWKCGTFEVEFEAEQYQDFQGEESFVAHVRARVEVGLRSGEPPWDAALEVVRLDPHYRVGPDCSATDSVGHVQPFRLYGVPLQIPTAGKKPADGEMWLELSPGRLVTHVDEKCPRSWDSQYEVDFYHALFLSLHNEEMILNDGREELAYRIVFTGSEFTGGEPYAEKRYSRAASSGSAAHRGTFRFTILHRPPPP